MECAGGSAVVVHAADGEPALLIAERDGLLMWMEVRRGYRRSAHSRRAGLASAAAKRNRANPDAVATLPTP
jgi:hypothetical protein